MLRKLSYFILILLVEGAALMAVELMGAKLLAPFYGSSLFVWTAVLGFTVTGLTIGYFLGGHLSGQNLSEKTLFTILGIAAILVFALPYTTGALIACTSGFNLIVGVCISCLLLLLPPMLCFGMVGPITVKLLAGNEQSSGHIAGIVYFVSTLGGIIATFLLGFYLIPLSGLKFCSILTSLSLAALQIIYIIRVYLLKKPLILVLPQQALPTDNKKNKQTKVNSSVTGSGKINPSVYGFAILEGATVMAVELMAARMLAPWFGTSLYVWTAVMAFTLLGLAMGYFIGGRLPGRYKLPGALWWALLIAALFLLLMHLTARQFTVVLNTLNIKTSVIFISLALILPPLLFLGMVPVLLIRYISSVSANVGVITGRIFTISSASGIIALFLFGFYIIPLYGLTNPSIAIGIIVGIIPFLKLISQKKYISILFPIVIICSLSTRKVESNNDNIEIKYYSEGLLGQVLVADIYKFDTSTVNDRLLLVNRIGEAQINRNTGATKWEYPYYISSLCSKLPEKSNALMLGLGGGQIPNLLHYLKFNVDVVELDQRIVDVAQDYFYLNKDINVTVDDARHYLETTTKTYDVIIIDVFHGDITPPHLLSLEAFKKSASLLNKNGFIIVNFFGFLTGDIGKPGRSIYNTMTAAGLYTKILPTTGKEDMRNSLFVGGKQDLDFDSIRSQLSLYGKVVDIDTLFLDCKKFDLKNSMILTDDKPALDLLNMDGVIDFRSSYTDIIKQFLKQGIPLFE